MAEELYSALSTQEQAAVEVERDALFYVSEWVTMNLVYQKRSKQNQTSVYLCISAAPECQFTA